ncbi:MAG: glycogen-binding domain-containing protein [Pseudomonadota bacterium]
MASKRSKQTVKRKKVTFKFVSPDSGSVSLVGNFNNWDKTSHPMTRKENGEWSATVILSEGTHQYKFLADNNWQQDPENEKQVPNEFGTLNNIIDVK